MFLVLIFFKVISCFNLDSSYPIVIKNPDTWNKRGSYFGYSLILYPGNDQSIPWIQIGAPRGRKQNSSSVETGAIFRCRLYGACKRIEVDSESIEGRTHEGFNYKGTLKESWIGNAMDIDLSSGRSAVCGHRWMDLGIYMEGICYWSYLNETEYFRRLLPLVDKSKSIYTHRNLYFYALGQAGFSVHFTKSQNRSELLLGAPGVSNWEGTCILYTSSYDKKSQREPIKPNVGNPLETMYTTVQGYFGYSVTTGCFFAKHDFLYVAGAPRANSFGEVYLFEFGRTTGLGLRIRDLRKGKQLGEYFGAAVIAGDINSDGYDDLVVGAPFYSTSTYNEGKIYVFLGNPMGTLEVPLHWSSVIGKQVGGQFGMTLSILGDIDMDGFIDVAVGAPYEAENGGSVYIFRGSPDGLIGIPSQKIMGKSLIPNIRGFGISISNAVDLDNNAYNDVAVGAYLSEHVVVLKSRPPVTLQMSMKSHVPVLEINSKNFEVESCLWFTGKFVSQTINVIRIISVDELLFRAYLPDVVPSSTLIELDRNRRFCQNITFEIKQYLSNYYDPIVVTVVQELSPRELHSNDFCKTCPVFDEFNSKIKETVEVPFALGCGNDNICESNLQLSYRFLNAENNTYVVGSSKIIILEIEVRNDGENAFLTQLLLELPKSAQFKSIPKICAENSRNVTCYVGNPLGEHQQKVIKYELEVKGMVEDRSQLDFVMRVLTKSKNLNSERFVGKLHLKREADITVSGTSTQQSYVYGNATTIAPNFTQVYQVQKFGASPIDQISLHISVPSHIRKKNYLEQFLKIYNIDGKSEDGYIKCFSSLLVVSNIYTKEEGLLNLKFDEDNLEMGDRKRSSRNADEVLEDNHFPNIPYNSTFNISCSNPFFHCEYINCSLNKFLKERDVAKIFMRMEMDVNLLTEFIHPGDTIVFTTEAEVKIIKPTQFIQTGERPDFTSVNSFFISDFSNPQVEIKVYFFSAVGGFVILVIVIIVLCQLGFFRREIKKELEAMRTAKVGVE